MSRRFMGYLPAFGPVRHGEAVSRVLFGHLEPDMAPAEEDDDSVVVVGIPELWFPGKDLDDDRNGNSVVRP